MCHIAQNFMLLGSMQHGSCTIQPTKIAFSSFELTEMITRCGLNRLYQFATFLATHLRASRKDPNLLRLLQHLDQVLYSGLALPREDEQWALQQGLRLTNLFGNTECGAMLLSVSGTDLSARALEPISGTRYGFFPITPQSESEHTDANSQLLELVILSESGDCPDPLLRAADGHYHTGDLFIEISPGKYISRGRDDDWIKTQNSLRCDTKAIEDQVRITCGDLIAECIVVGNGRPSPALFVEPKTDMTEEKLKKTIIRRTRPFNDRRYIHERITSPAYMFVVPKGTLPRTATKGNIRRKAVEEAYKAQLDEAYGMSF
jgi:acyl-coenzyme A synthetase/AMP-(fatty) acid ligase